MEAVTPYLNQVNDLLGQSANRKSEWTKKVQIALDGQPSREIRKLVPISTLRATGTFFTGHDLAKTAFSGFSTTINSKSQILDPTVGVGDLLLSAAERLPLKNGAISTIKAWGDQLTGFDIHSKFVEIAKIRLTLKCMVRGNFQSLPKGFRATDFFPNICSGSALDVTDAYSRATHILLNPPYTSIISSGNNKTKGSKVSAAAVFTKHVIEKLTEGTRILAILPDVLRSGSRYSTWREFIQRNVSINRISLYGLFDSQTDVDVFILEGIKTARRKPYINWNKVRRNQKNTVGDLFKVSVGSVVDFRDPHLGNWKKYLTAKDTTNWKEVNRFKKSRRFSGTTFVTPFVTVKRTSRHGDLHRAVGAIIKSRYPVAVDNHLIILQPKDGKLSTCRTLMKILKSERTSKWLDDRIRCRHLTVISLRELPWQELSK